MGDRELAVHTTARDEDGRMVTFPAGTVVSDKVAEGITNPKAWAIRGDGGPARLKPAEPAKKAPAKRAASSKSEK